MIEKFINRITQDATHDNEFNTVWVFRFFGDGLGDFEKSSLYTTQECLKNYIDDCKEQIKFAKQELANLEKNK
jgi:hypothetical protein